MKFRRISRTISCGKHSVQLGKVFRGEVRRGWSASTACSPVRFSIPVYYTTKYLVVDESDGMRLVEIRLFGSPQPHLTFHSRLLHNQLFGKAPAADSSANILACH
jgi:hypothetical protein